MNSRMIMLMELLPQLVLVGGCVWAALSRDEARSSRRRLMVWGVVWVMLIAVIEAELAMGPKDCQCCAPTLWKMLAIHAFVYIVLAAAVALVGAAIYYPMRWAVQRWRQQH